VVRQTDAVQATVQHCTLLSVSTQHRLTAQVYNFNSTLQWAKMP